MPLAGRGNGPGGVPDCVAWYEPESLTGANGSAISSWPDRSPNALNATQGTAGKQPTVVAPALNGHPGAKFDGTDDVLFLDAAVAGPIARNVGGFTMVAVAATATVATGSARLFSASTGGSAGANRSTLGRDTDFIRVGGRRLDGDTFATRASPAGSFPLNTFRVITGNLDYAAAVARIFLDGTEAVASAWQTAGNTSDTSSIAVAIGAQASDSTFFNGTIVEIAVFDRTLTAAERSAVHSYMQDKFGITVSDYTATGGGALTAAPATVSGSGTADSGGVTGSGTLTTSAAGVAGAGNVTTSGTGALTTNAGSLAGSGTATATGSGALGAPAATLAGSGAAAATGSGTLTASAPMLSGAGTTAARGSGSLTAATSTATGAGTVTVTGSGTTAAPSATLSGAGQVSSDVTGSGSLTTAPVSLAAAGTLTATGTGALTATPSVLSGADEAPVTGAGTLTLAPATLTGLASLATSGTGALLAPAATLTGGDTDPGRDLTIQWPTTGRSRELSAVGRSRSLAAAGCSRTLTATPRE